MERKKEGSFSLATSEKTIAIPLHIDMSKVKKKKICICLCFLVLFVQTDGTNSWALMPIFQGTTFFVSQKHSS